jgi:hypothetical protein
MAPMAKRTRISFWTDQKFKDRLAAVAEKLGLSESVVGAAAIEAVIAHVEKTGSLSIPIRLSEVPKPQAPIQHGAAAEDSGIPSTQYSLNDPSPKLKKPVGGPRPKSTRASIKKTIAENEGRS